MHKLQYPHENNEIRGYCPKIPTNSHAYAHVHAFTRVVHGFAGSCPRVFAGRVHHPQPPPQGGGPSAVVWQFRVHVPACSRAISTRLDTSRPLLLLESRVSRGVSWVVPGSIKHHLCHSTHQPVPSKTLPDPTLPACLARAVSTTLNPALPELEQGGPG